MFFFFLLTAMAGGFMASRGFNEGDPGIGALGVGIAVVSIIANGFIGLPA